MAYSKDPLQSDIREMKISDLYHYAINNKHPNQSHNQSLGSGLLNNLGHLTIELLNTKHELLLTKNELERSAELVSTLDSDLSRNRSDLQQSRIEVQQSRLETQQTRLELMNFKNDSKLVLENLNNKLDQFISLNQNGLNTFYQNIVNNLDQHFNEAKSTAPDEEADEDVMEEDDGEELLEEDEAYSVEENESAVADANEVTNSGPNNQAESNSKNASDAGIVESEVDKTERVEENEIVRHEPEEINGSESDNLKKSRREPMYRMIRGTDSVLEIWEEYIRGINGGPAVKELEEKYQFRWRDDKERSMLGHRKRIYTMIEKAVSRGWNEKEALVYLDRYATNEFGEKRSFNWLFENAPPDFR